jgi:hypothetical protein
LSRAKTKQSKKRSRKWQRGADESGGECRGLLGKGTNKEQERTFENVFDKTIFS